MECEKVSASSGPQAKEGSANGIGGGRGREGVGSALFGVGLVELRGSATSEVRGQELSPFGQGSEEGAVVGLLDTGWGGGSDGPTVVDTGGPWGGTGPGEAVDCVMFEQQPRFDGRQLVQGLLALAQTQYLHLPPALQRQH